MDIYRERAHFVAFLTKCFPASRWVDEREPNYPVIAIETQAGQLSWHVATEDLDLFGHVTEQGTWDGHSTEEKYQRLDQIGNDMAALTQAFLPKLREVFAQYQAADA